MSTAIGNALCVPTTFRLHIVAASQDVTAEAMLIAADQVRGATGHTRTATQPVIQYSKTGILTRLSM